MKASFGCFAGSNTVICISLWSNPWDFRGAFVFIHRSIRLKSDVFAFLKSKGKVPEELSSVLPSK